MHLSLPWLFVKGFLVFFFAAAEVKAEHLGGSPGGAFGEQIRLRFFYFAHNFNKIPVLLLL